MSFDVDVEYSGFDEVKQRIEFLTIQIDSVLTLEELTIVAERILELALQDVRFRTGALRASLQIFIDRTELRVVVGTDIGYGKFVELGTSKMQAHPYLVPALFTALNEFKERYPERIKEMSKVKVGL